MPGSLVSLPVFAKRGPKEGPKYCPLTFAFDGTQSIQSLTFAVLDSGMSQISSIYIDNFQNSFGVVVGIGDTGQQIGVPAHCRVTAPVFTGTLNFSISVQFKSDLPQVGVSANPLTILLFNFWQEYHEEFIVYGIGPPFASPQTGQVTLTHGGGFAAVIPAFAGKVRQVIIPDPASATTDQYDIGFADQNNNPPTIATYRYFGNAWNWEMVKPYSTAAFGESRIYVALTASSNRTVNYAYWLN